MITATFLICKAFAGATWSMWWLIGTFIGDILLCDTIKPIIFQFMNHRYDEQDE